MENLLTITANARSDIGKRTNKALRREGMIPAIIYGLKADSLPVSVSVTDIKKVLKSESGENSILRIVHEKSKLDAMIKQIQYDYLSKDIIHIDFIRIDLNKPVDVSVPIVLEGEPVGIRTEDGLLDFVTREVMVRCLPAKIPRMIKVDIAELHIGHSIKLEEIDRDQEIQFLSHPHTVVCSVVARAREEVKEVVPTAEEAAAAAAAAAGEEQKPAAEGAAPGTPAATGAKKEAAAPKKEAAAPKKEKEG